MKYGINDHSFWRRNHKRFAIALHFWITTSNQDVKLYVEIEVKKLKLQLAKEEYFFTTIFAQFLTEQKKKSFQFFHAPVTKGDVSYIALGLGLRPISS